MSKATIGLIAIAALDLKAGTQFRSKLDADAITNYTQLLKEWKERNTKETPDKPMGDWDKCPLPPITVFITPKTAENPDSANINADGFHRIKGAQKAGLELFRAEMREGTREDAIKYALQANADHGVPLTNEDKQNKLKAALKIPAFVELSNNGLAGKIGVSESFVRVNRPATATPVVRKAVSKSGKVTAVNTARIGKGGGKAKKVTKKAAKAAATKAAAAATKAAGKSATTAVGSASSWEGSGGENTETEEEKKERETLEAAAGKQFDPETEKALKRVGGILTEKKTADGDKFIQAFRTGVLEHLAIGDIKSWALSDPTRIAELYPLVTGPSKMKVKAAFAFLDQVPDEKMRLGHLFNLATAKGGHVLEYGEGFGILIFRKDDYALNRNMALGTYTVIPKGKEAEYLAALQETA